MIKISASILDVNILEIKENLIKVENLIDRVHFDIADGCFVPNLTFGPKFIRDLKNVVNKQFEAHLMVFDPSKFFRELEKLVYIVYFHVNATKSVIDDIKFAKSLGLKVGIALSPEIQVEDVVKYLPEVDGVLVMLVKPGYGGQKMDELQLKKIQLLDEYRRRNKLSYEIAADGGIKPYNASRVAAAGADVLVSGSGIFGEDPVQALLNFKKELKMYE